jgi:hypothetical protein
VRFLTITVIDAQTAVHDTGEVPAIRGFDDRAVPLGDILTDPFGRDRDMPAGKPPALHLSVALGFLEGRDLQFGVGEFRKRPDQLLVQILDRRHGHQIIHSPR